jgi:hypothetical protein
MVLIGDQAIGFLQSGLGAYDGRSLCRSNFGPECVRCPLEGLCDGFLSEDFVLQIVLTGVTVTASRNAVESTGKAFTIELETFTVAAITAPEILGRRLQSQRLLRL